MTLQSFPLSSVIFAGIETLMTLLLPLAVLLFASRKTTLRALPVFLGAITFIIAVIFLEANFHALVIGAIKNSPIWNNIFWFALYSSLAAGIFEETGRFLCMKYLHKKYKDDNTALLYGIGHGGIEVWLFTTLGALSSLIIMLTVNSGSAASLTAADTTGSVQSTINSLYGINPAMYLVATVERIAAMCVHICLSYWVWLAVTRKKLFKFYPAAIAAHAVVDITAVLYQRTVIKNIYVIELIVFMIAALIAFVTVKMYRRVKSDEERSETEKPGAEKLDKC